MNTQPQQRPKSQRNLYNITGPRGQGKTVLALTHARPSEMGGVYVHDDEGSSNHSLAELERQGMRLGWYVDLEERFDIPGEEDMVDRIARGDLPWANTGEKENLSAYYQFVVQELADHLIPGQFHTYILDTLGTFEAGMAAYVRTHRKETGWKTDSYGRMWTDAVWPLYHHFLKSIWDRGVDTIILCSHLKNVWQGNQPVPGKTTMMGKKVLQFWSSLTLWLVAGEDSSGAPAGLVLKERMGRMDADKDADEWNLRRMLPHRLPVCTWKEIRRYLEEGCDLANPAPGETMSKAEAEMISPLLVDKQLELMILQATKELERNGDSGLGAFAAKRPAPVTPADLVGRVRELSVENEDNVVIRTLRAEGHRLPTIMRAIKAARSTT